MLEILVPFVWGVWAALLINNPQMILWCGQDERGRQTEGGLGVLNLGSFFMHVLPRLCSKPSPGPLWGP